MKHKISHILMQGIIYMNKRLVDINSTLMDISKALMQQNLLLKDISHAASTDMVTNMKALHTAREATQISKEAIELQKRVAPIKPTQSYAPQVTYEVKHGTSANKHEAATAPDIENERFMKSLGNWVVDGFQVMDSSHRRNITTNLKEVFGELDTEIIAATLDIEEKILDMALSDTRLLSVGIAKYIAAKLKIGYKVLILEQQPKYIKRLGELWRQVIFSADYNNITGNTVDVTDNQTASILGQLRRWKEKGVFDD